MGWKEILHQLRSQAQSEPWLLQADVDESSKENPSGLILRIGALLVPEDEEHVRGVACEISERGMQRTFNHYALEGTVFYYGKKSSVERVPQLSLRGTDINYVVMPSACIRDQPWQSVLLQRFAAGEEQRVFFDTPFPTLFTPESSPPRINHALVRLLYAWNDSPQVRKMPGDAYAARSMP